MSSDPLRKALRNLVQHEVRVALNAAFDKKLNAVLETRLNGELDAKLRSAVGDRLSVVDRLVDALNGSATLAVVRPAQPRPSAQVAARRQRPAARPKRAKASATKAAKVAAPRAPPSAKAASRPSVVKAAAPTPAVSRKGSPARSAAKSVVKPAAKPPRVSSVKAASIPFKKGFGKRMENPTVGAKVFVKQGKGTFRGFIKAKKADGQFVVKREDNGKEYVREANGLYAA